MFAFNSLTQFLILMTIAFINAQRFKRSPIVTDDVATKNQFPYAVAIISVETGIRCSGGIIHEKFILSAAHCFIGKLTNTFTTETFMIYAGTNNLLENLDNQTEEQKSGVSYVTKIFIPKDYDSATRRSDIAVLKLAEYLDLSKPQFQKLHLPLKCRELHVGQKAETAAFGYCEYSSTPINATHSIIDRAENDGMLRYAIIEITDQSNCGDKKPHDKYEIQNFHLLGKMVKESTEKYGLCYGDSGSPLVYRADTAIGTIYTVFGVFIDAFVTGCDGRTLPAVFTRIRPYIGFIHDAMEGKVNERTSVRDIGSEKAG